MTESETSLDMVHRKESRNENELKFDNHVPKATTHERYIEVHETAIYHNVSFTLHFYFHLLPICTISMNAQHMAIPVNKVCTLGHNAFVRA
jgi:hypothetical protein